MQIEIPSNINPDVEIHMPFKVAEFEKVSFEQFEEAMLENHFDVYKEFFQVIYDSIKLPERATKGSAGYDFFSPVSFVPPTGDRGIVIPTGIRCNMEPGWVLQMYPRSGHGFKFGVHLYNTIGIIDQDYYYADNEGHIMVKISAKEPCKTIELGDAFCQGIFMPFGITKNDNVEEIRTGGFGSTSK